jgi:Ca2+-binding EF-hand superfamily protein
MRSSRFRHVGLSAIALLVWSALHADAQFPDAPRPDLPPLPERRSAVLKEFDQDQDGRLNQAEREAARKAWAAKRLAERGDRGFFGPPPEIIEEFDTNKDGELDATEGRTAGQTMERRFRKLTTDYDKDGDGELDSTEVAAALRDLDAGKLKGIPRMFLQFAGSRRPRRAPPPANAAPGAPETLAPREVLSQSDADHDGRLSPEELAAARAAFAQRRAAMARIHPEIAQPPTSPQP